MNAPTTCSSCGTEILSSEEFPSLCVRCALTFALGDVEGEYPTTPLPDEKTAEAAAFSGSIRGELDWIVLEAIANDRPSRHGSLDDLSEDMTVREVLDRASANVSDRFKGKPLLKAYLHQVMARSYLDLGEFEEAEKHAAAAARLRRDSLGDEDP